MQRLNNKKVKAVVMGDINCYILNRCELYAFGDFPCSAFILKNNIQNMQRLNNKKVKAVVMGDININLNSSEYTSSQSEY